MYRWPYYKTFWTAEFERSLNVLPYRANKFLETSPITATFVVLEVASRNSDLQSISRIFLLMGSEGPVALTCESVVTAFQFNVRTNCVQAVNLVSNVLQCIPCYALFLVCVNVPLSFRRDALERSDASNCFIIFTINNGRCVYLVSLNLPHVKFVSVLWDQEVCLPWLQLLVIIAASYYQ